MFWRGEYSVSLRYGLRDCADQVVSDTENSPYLSV